MNSYKEIFREELMLLRKLMIEYWKNSGDEKDGTVDLSPSYEAWASCYTEELMHECFSEEAAKQKIRRAISEYLDMIGGENK